MRERRACYHCRCIFSPARSADGAGRSGKEKPDETSKNRNRRPDCDASGYCQLGGGIRHAGDIEEAGTQQGYNAYEYQSSDAAYDDSELLAVEGDYVATANAMIRQSPFGTILGSVQPGATYHVVGECPDCMWYKISGDVSGYVYASYLVPAGEYQQASNSNSDTGANIRSLDMLMTVDVLESSALNLREAPSTDSGVVTSVPAGTEIRVTGNVLNTDWYQCEHDGRIGYVWDEYMEAVGQ